MAATPSIRVIKTFQYRGVNRTFSNRYHFNGGTPADTAHWTTLSDAIVTAEKAIYTNWVSITETIGYAAGSEVPVFSKVYSTAGTGGWGAASRATGDSAILVRYATTARTSKNHPVYLFNYYHGAYTDGVSVGDTPNSTQKTAVSTYATSWLSGFSDGTTSYVRAGPKGATAVGALVESWLTHRDFPR